ncbi:MAG: hypothetical protein AAF773_20495, partial [Cyanobacteria bacterium P01_D01_bin.115]
MRNPIIAQIEEVEGSAPSAASQMMNSLGGAFDSLKGTNGIILGVMVLGLVGLKFFGGGGKSGQIARGALSGAKEKSKARRQAVKQIKEG